MTRLEFLAECNTHLVNYFIALENDKIREALKERNDQEVIRLLQEEF